MVVWVVVVVFNLFFCLFLVFIVKNFNIKRFIVVEMIVNLKRMNIKLKVIYLGLFCRVLLFCRVI